LNLKEIRDELILILGNRALTIIPNTRYNLWINNAEVEIASAFQFFQTEKWVYRSTVVGSASYALPSDCLAIYSLRDATNKRKIIRTGYRKLDNVDFTLSQTPTHYLRYGSNIQLYPTPSSIITIQLRHCVNLTALSADSDVPTLPTPWHEAILLGSEYRGWRAIGEVKKAQIVKAEYIALIRSRKADWEIEDSDEEFGMEVMK
jgi:hypothetical protein